jgi:hypothetical protein
LPKRADFLLASHVLDDMLMSEWVKQVPARHDPVFSWSSTASYAPAVTDAFRAQWDAFQMIPKPYPQPSIAETDVAPCGRNA